jgi:hypothetical protein
MEKPNNTWLWSVVLSACLALFGAILWTNSRWMKEDCGKIERIRAERLEVGKAAAVNQAEALGAVWRAQSELSQAQVDTEYDKVRADSFGRSLGNREIILRSATTIGEAAAARHELEAAEKEKDEFLRQAAIHSRREQAAATALERATAKMREAQEEYKRIRMENGW